MCNGVAARKQTRSKLSQRFVYDVHLLETSLPSTFLKKEDMGKDIPSTSHAFLAIVMHRKHLFHSQIMQRTLLQYKNLLSSALLC